MGQAHADGSGAPSMSIAERFAFSLLPAAALGVVLWLLATYALPVDIRLPWIPALGVGFDLHIDGLAVLMLLMITGIGVAVFAYAGGYLDGHPQQRRLYVLLTMFMLAMIGCVTADHLIVLFLFWEATSLVSFLLVGFDHTKADSRKSAQQALMVTASGGLAMFAGFLLLWQIMGTASISEIVRLLPTMEQTPALTTALVLILVGAFTKSAQVPFHFWLPNAMSAPTPVSAYLHSATMVKLGVYLVARLDPGFGHWEFWQWTLQGFGAVTAAWAMLLALRERDLKRILAWSTVATLGTLVMLVGLDGTGATLAVGALLLAHALYKAPLFFVAGNVDHGTGTRIIDRLGNLRHAMPWTAAAAALAGASMAGVPLSFGYVAKDVISAAKEVGHLLAFAEVANIVFGAIAVAVAAVAAVRVFWRHPGVNVTPGDAHEGGVSLVAPPLLLAAFGVALGVFPFVVQDLIAEASRAMLPAGTAPELQLEPALAPALGSLAVTLAIGAVVFWFWDPLHRVFERLSRSVERFSAVSQYERLLRAIPSTSAACTRLLQDGRLPFYAGLMIASVTALMAAALVAGWRDLQWPALTNPGVGVTAAAVVVCIGAVAATLLRDRLTLLLAAGLVGYGSGVLFLFVGAPDVAFTQFAVETVFVVVVASVLLKLHRLGLSSGLAERRPRPLALLIAVGFGSVVTLGFLAVNGVAFDDAITRYFGEVSVVQAFGRNVVNVILVDFRALDTLGEIAVVMLSMLAALPLVMALRARSRREPKAATEARP
jgi:multicomponent Na+:H+ antiporter subunit A